jgi:REP-associated tyrosine transposase
MRHRKPNRLSEFKYSSGYAYFVTLCTHQKQKLFGDIQDEISVLSQPGTMIKNWWLELEKKFHEVELDEFIVMPDHMHGIIIINPVGDDLRVVPKQIDPVGAELRVNPRDKHVGLSLPKIIQWFKTMTTNEYIKRVKENEYSAFSEKTMAAFLL